MAAPAPVSLNKSAAPAAGEPGTAGAPGPGGKAGPRPLELTLRVVIIGLTLSVVMGAANVYLGLKAGMTVSASIPAAVVAMLILRGVFRNGTVLEANLVQTAASAGESLAAGIIFTMPAIVLIGVWNEFDFFTTAAVAFAGGLLGILFMIPMRRVFVVDDPELKYPEGVACAAVLQAGEAGTDGTGGGDGKQGRRVIAGALLGIIYAIGIKFLGVFKGAAVYATAVGNRIFYFGGEISPALIAVGFIVKLEIAVLIFIGGALSWLVGIPLLEAGAEALANPEDGAFGLWAGQIRYVGVGAMVMGGLASIYKVRGGLVRAIQELRRKPSEAEANDERHISLSGRTITLWGLVATGIIVTIYYQLTGSVPATAVTAVAMLVMSFFFTAVASYIVGLVGNSNSPVSGMTITAVLFTGALLYVLGFAGVQGMVATLGVAAVVCCAACTSGDVCNDLKTGLIVGASPRKQQIMQIAGVAAAALVMAPVLNLLHTTTPGGIGGKELAAPQAQLFASLARGFFGDGQLPMNMVFIGAGLGAAILALDAFQVKRGASFRFHLMPIAVGMYLPFDLAPPILAGGLVATLLSRGLTEHDAEVRLRPGVLFSSGVVAGESLTGIALAVLTALNVGRPSLGLSPTLLTALTVAAGAVAVWLFYRNGVERKRA